MILSDKIKQFQLKRNKIGKEGLATLSNPTKINKKKSTKRVTCLLFGMIQCRTVKICQVLPNKTRYDILNLFMLAFDNKH